MTCCIDPKSQEDFLDDQVVSNVSSVDPGHQCYKLQTLQEISPGTNATIQMEYWGEFEGENNGNNQSFFACADITFVEAKDFKINAPCFNVTSDEFLEPTASSSPSSPSPTAGQSDEKGNAEDGKGGGGGLSTGAKAGIAVGAVIGGLALMGIVAFFMWRRGRAMGLKGKDEYELRAKNLGSPEPAAGTRA